MVVQLPIAFNDEQVYQYSFSSYDIPVMGISQHQISILLIHLIKRYDIITDILVDKKMYHVIMYLNYQT